MLTCVKAVIIIIPLVWASLGIKDSFDAYLDTEDDANSFLCLLQVQVDPHKVHVADAKGHTAAGVAGKTLHVEGEEESAFFSDQLKRFPRRLRWGPSIICAVSLLLVAGCGVFKAPDRNQEEQLEEVMESHGLTQPFWHDPFSLRDFQKETLRKAAPRVALALSCWLIGLYSNNLCQAWLQSRMEGYYDERWASKRPSDQSLILWDFGHYIWGDSSVEPWVSDTWANMVSSLTFVRFILFPGPFSMRWTVLSRMFLIWGCLWAFRGIVIVSTVMPNPEKTCKPAITFPDNVFLEALANMPFVFWKAEVTCEDVIFSGHAVAMTLATMVSLHYAERAPWPQFQAWYVPGPLLFKTALVTNLLVGFFIIIVSKTHYTSDVLLGFMVAALAFQAYHAALAIAFLPKSKLTVLSAGICPILPLLRWLEEDAVDVACLKKSLLQQQGMKLDSSPCGPN